MDIERTDLIISIKSSLIHFVGGIAFQLDMDPDLRDTPHWNDELEKDFEENLCERFDIDIDLNKIDILTIDNIADAVYYGMGDVRETSGSSKPDEIPKNRKGQKAETIDLESLLLVLNKD